MRHKQFLISILTFFVGVITASVVPMHVSALDPRKIIEEPVTAVEGIKNRIEDRIEERKIQFQTQVSQANTGLISERCEAAQVKLGTIRTQSSEITRSQLNKYETIIARLTALQSKFEKQGVQTENLTVAIDKLKLKSNQINTSLSTYLTGLDDTRNIDCATDPAGFIVSLAAARESLDAAKVHHEDFKEQIQNITKFILPGLKEFVHNSSVQVNS